MSISLESRLGDNRTPDWQGRSDDRRPDCLDQQAGSSEQRDLRTAFEVVTMARMAGNIVGVRELKTRLGTYLRRVRRGHRIVVTHRGQPVAELRPIGGEADLQSILTDLEAKGIVARPSRKTLTPFRLIVSRGDELSTAVVEDRGDRSARRAV